MNVALLALLPVLMTQALRTNTEMVRDPDVWWHLANARILVSTHHFIRVEPYAFTVVGEPWMDPEWLAEVPLWAAYKAFHLSGLWVSTWLLLSGNTIAVYWRCWWRTRQAGAAFWCAAVGFLLMTVNAGPRTILFGYLCLSAELAILDAAEQGGERLLWLLPPLFLVWVNLHGSWLIGLSLLGAYLLGSGFGFSAGSLVQAKPGPGTVRRWVLVFVATVAALLVNPYGWRLVLYPFDMLMNQQLNVAVVEEWQPMQLGSAVGRVAMGCLVAMVVANLVRGRKWKLFEIVFLLFAWYAAFSHMRFAVLAAVIAMPYLTVDLVRSFSVETGGQATIPAMNALMAAGSLAVILYIFPGEAALQQGFRADFPMETIRSLDPRWRTFNAANLGGVMALESKPDYIDARMDTFEHHGVVAKYMEAIQIVRPLEVLQEDGIDHVLFAAHTPLIYTLERTPGWAVVTREGRGDDSYVLMARGQAGR
jgi:hypothetical protein